METTKKYICCVLFLTLTYLDKNILASDAITKCLQTSSCEFCSHHQYCHIFNKCCCEKERYMNIEPSTLQPLGRDQVHRMKFEELSSYYSCSIVNNYKYYIFDRCPSYHKHKNFVTSCEKPNKDDLLHDVPAFGETTKFLYRNIYCAQCHGESYILWNISYKCFGLVNESLDKYTNIVDSGQCKKVPFISRRLEPYLIPCGSEINNCLHSSFNDFIENHCNSSSLGRSMTKTFHCGLSDINTNADGVCCLQPNLLETSRLIFQPLTIIFDYNKNYLIIKENIGGTIITRTLPYCPGHLKYDRNTMSCRIFFDDTFLNCTATIINESDYHITSDGRLYLNNTRRLLNQSEFNQDEHGLISVCVKSSDNRRYKYYDAEGYITFVGLIISVPAVAITIIVYLCIPELRTLPGKLLISLLSALFLAELLFLISSCVTPPSLLCICLAVVKHYSFLATFFWMNVMSFDAWYTFSGLTQLRHIGKSTKKFVLYSLYAWISPFLIVTLSMIFQFIPGENGMSPDYGGSICWIQNGDSLLWLFVLPVIIILCFNLIAYIFTARGLYASTKLSTKYLSKHNKNVSYVYIKLSFLMGITWIFSFLNIFTKIDEFSLIFCILNSFAGLFIALSFLLTNLVKRFFLRAFYRFQENIKLPNSEVSTVLDKTQKIEILSKQQKISPQFY